MKKNIFGGGAKIKQKMLNGSENDKKKQICVDCILIWISSLNQFELNFYQLESKWVLKPSLIKTLIIFLIRLPLKLK